MKDNQTSSIPGQPNGKVKIRILHCIETIASGGVEQVRLTMIRGLDREKYEHKIICTWKGGPVAEALEAEGVELIPIGSFRHPFQWSKYKQVLKIIKSYRPHIIHGAIFEGMSMAAIGGKLGKVPVIILEETSHPIARSIKARWLQRLFAKAADKVIGIAPTVVNYLIETVGIPHSNVQLINNGVSIPKERDTEELETLKNQLGIQEGDFIIGSAGRFYNEVKRFTDIMEAIALLDNTKIKFLLLGQGKDESLIVKKAKEFQIQDQLILAGFQEDITPYFQLMDIFCIASAHEGFGLVAAEAMLLSLPIIATRVGGLQDIVLDEETGFLIEPAHPNQIVKKIKWLIDHPEEGLGMGTKGKKRAMENYTAVRYCQEIDQLYTGLLVEKGMPLL